VRARRCMGAGHGAGPRAPATIFHAETSYGNGSELCITLRAPFGVRWRGRGAGAVSACLVLIWGGFEGPAARHLHHFAPFLHQCVELGRALPRVVAVERGVECGGRQVPKTTDFAMSSTLNHCCSPVRGSPAPIHGSMCSHVYEPSNACVRAENGGPSSPCGLPIRRIPFAGLAHDSSAEEGHCLPSAPTKGHGWCLYGLLTVPAFSMHGRRHRAQVAGATGACLHAWALRESVLTPPPRGCTAWQGMGCEHGARAVHKRAVRWRRHSTRHQRLLPWRSARLLLQWAGCSACTQVHHRLQAAGSQAAGSRQQ